MPALHHLSATAQRGALVLLFVLSCSLVALAGNASAPFATDVRATTTGASTLITVSGTAPMAYTVKRPDARTILVELPGVDASRLAASYTVASPLVEKVTVERTELTANQTSPRLRVLLRAPVRDRSHMADNNLVLELSPESAANLSAKTAAPQPTPTPAHAGLSINTSSSSPQSSQGQQYGSPGFVGEPINLNVVNADIRDILNYITEQYGVNFVIDSSVGAVPVTVNVTDVPWNIALDAILRANRLGIDVNGNILRVAARDLLATEAAEQQKIREAQLDNSPLYTEFIRLNYARASGTLASAAGSTGNYSGGTVGVGGNQSFSGGEGGDATGGGGDQGILPIINRRLSRRGSVEVDGRSNTLIITDVRENIDAIRQLVLLLDQPEPQVEIETRIVIANRSFSRDLGVQLAASIFNPRGNQPGASFNTLPNGANGPGPQPGIAGGLPGSLQPTNGLGANLPSTVIGLTTGLIGTAQISAAITAAETKGTAKVIASPRVTALNNRPAQIESGQQIPVVTPQTGAGGTGGALVFTTTFVSVPLRLSITPQITDVGTVVLRVVAENNSINQTIAVAGTPGIDTQRMQTEVLVPDGGTTVIGGVLADNESELHSRTPGLGSIPVLGNLFKRKTTTRQTNEILFFITPRIYRPDFQGNPTSGTVSTGTRSTTILQPVPLGNPQTNTPTPSQLQPQQQPNQNAQPTAVPNGQQTAPQGPASRP